MKVTTFEGIIENGQIRLPANVRLPEKTKVYVVVPDIETLSIAYVGSPRLAHPEQARDFEKQVIEETNDGRI
jgi:hypothetical protein